MPAGRPTKYKREMCAKVVPHMRQGFSKESLAGLFKVNQDTIYEWAKVHPEFSESIKDGVEASRHFWEKLGVEGASGSDAFNATAWIFNMKNRFKWTDRQEHTGPDGGPIKTESKVLNFVGVDAGHQDTE